ncbi:MOSC domain-containing protein [Streptomyces sp. NPDC058653]|uniref:MOSC domain-containing protein n=1 Tax=Streptomyces sp. NPDC058653 TaxID=3346576 RepID=UPI0036660368
MPQPSSPVLRALRVHPVKSVGGFSADSAVVEPWGLAGDRRWTLVDESGSVVTQREQPRLALARAELLPGGGLVLYAPGRERLEVAPPGGDALPADGRRRGGQGRSGAGVNAVRTGDPRTDGAETGVGVTPVDAHTNDIVVDVFGTRVDASLVDARAHEWFSRHLGVEVRLVHLSDPVGARPIDPRYGLPGETVSFADGYPLLAVSLSSLDALNSLIAQGDHADEGPLPLNRFRPNLVVAGTAPWAEDEWVRVTVGEVTFRVAKPCGRCVITTTDQRTAERGKEPLRTLARHRRFGGRLIFGQNLVPENTGTVQVGDAVKVLTA